jgi:small-conductance mechanosensitive channel
MEFDGPIFTWLIVLLLALAGAFFLRFLLQRYGSQLVGKTSWALDDLLIQQLTSKIIFWVLLLVIFLAANDLLELMNTKEELGFYIKRTIIAAFILSFTHSIVEIVSSLLAFRNSENSNTSSILRNIAKILLYLISFLLVIQNYGVQVYPLVATLGIGGLAVALALQPTLSNLFSGLQIIASKKIEIGDLIELENGKKGIVSDIAWRNTTITTWQNNTIIIPNSKIVDSIVENYFHAGREFLFSIPLGVSYASDLDQVEKVLVEIASSYQKSLPDCVHDFEPFVRFQKFGESSIDLSVFMKSKDFGGQFMVITHFIPAVHKRFQEEGIEIPFPIRTVYLNNNSNIKPREENRMDRSARSHQ